MRGGARPGPGGSPAPALAGTPTPGDPALGEAGAQGICVSPPRARAQVCWAPVGTRPPRTSAIASCAAEPPLSKRRGRVRRAAPRGGRLRAPEMLPRVRPRGASAARGGPPRRPPPRQRPTGARSAAAAAGGLRGVRASEPRSSLNPQRRQDDSGFPAPQCRSACGPSSG